MKNKFYVMLFYVFLVLCMTGCGKHGELHEYDDFIGYVDNMQCGAKNRYVSCNLGGKYELVGTYDGRDENGEQMRTYSFKLKNDDILFDIISQYMCTGDIDGSCFDYTYSLNGFDYYEKAEKYHINKFNERFDYYNKMHNYPYNFYDDFLERFNVIIVDELNFVIDYFNGYLDYINELDGSLFYSFSVGYWILDITNNNAVIQGIYLGVCGLTFVLFSLFGGVLSDRFNKVKIIYICDYLKAILIALSSFIILSNSNKFLPGITILIISSNVRSNSIVFFANL